MGNNCKSACGCDTSEINTQQQFEVGYDKGLGNNAGNNMGSQQNIKRVRNPRED